MLGSTGSAASDRSLPVRFMCEFPLACVKIHHLVDGSSDVSGFCQLSLGKAWPRRRMWRVVKLFAWGGYGETERGPGVKGL